MKSKKHSESNVKHTGGCLCGNVRYTISAEPMMAGHCHCLSCQKLSGAGHAFHMMVPDEELHIEGRTQAFSWTADSGNTVTTSFCPTCGSPLFARSSGYPGMVPVRVASLDDPSVVAPQWAVYAKRLQPWDHIDPTLPAYPGLPPAPGGR
jgi:hypothetical protein